MATTTEGLSPGAPSNGGAEEAKRSAGSASADRGARGISPTRFFVFVLVGTLLGAAIGAGLGLLREDKYTATSTVLVAPLEGNPYSPVGSGDDLINLETEAQLVKSDTVTEAVASQLGASAAAVASETDVTVPPNTQVLRIAFKDGDPDVALKGSLALATEFLDFRERRGSSALQAQRDKLTRQLDFLRGQLTSLTRQIRNTANPAVRSVLGQRVGAVNTQVVDLQTERAQLADSPRDPGQIVNPAVEATRFPVPWFVLSLITFTVLGGFLGAVVGVSVNNRRLRAASESS